MKVKVIDYDHQGRGIAKQNGKIIFIPKVKKGCTVDVEVIACKKNYEIAICRNQPIKDPIACPHYFACGGCHLQHLTYEEQLDFKRKKVENILAKYTKFSIPTSLMIVGTKPFFYRNKVTFHVKKGTLGFYQEQTNQIFSLEYCPLLHPSIQKLISPIKKFVSTNEGVEEIMIRTLHHQIMLCFKGKIEKNKLVLFFKSLADSIYYNGKFIYGKSRLISEILNKKFLVAPEAFFQVNDEGLEKIYGQVINYIQKASSQRVLDLYCGTGTISLLVADYVKSVIGIEVNKQAIMNAKENARLNHMNNVTFYAGTTASILPTIKETIDTIIVDPPRSGLDKITKKQILQIMPSTIIYVSCDPLTLARDLNYFYDFYQVKEIRIIDEFPETYHVECVCVLNWR